MNPFDKLTRKVPVDKGLVGFGRTWFPYTLEGFQCPTRETALTVIWRFRYKMHHEHTVSWRWFYKMWRKEAWGVTEINYLHTAAWTKRSTWDDDVDAWMEPTPTSEYQFGYTVWLPDIRTIGKLRGWESCTTEDGTIVSIVVSTPEYELLANKVQNELFYAGCYIQTVGMYDDHFDILPEGQWLEEQFNRLKHLEIAVRVDICAPVYALDEGQQALIDKAENDYCDIHWWNYDDLALEAMKLRDERTWNDEF